MRMDPSGGGSARGLRVEEQGGASFCPATQPLRTRGQGTQEHPATRTAHRTLLNRCLSFTFTQVTLSPHCPRSHETQEHALTHPWSDAFYSFGVRQTMLKWVPS